MYRTQTRELILLLIFAIVVIASGADLVADLSHGADSAHIFKETLVVAISILAIGWLLWGLRRQRLEIKSLQRELESAGSPQAAPQKYVLEARKSLGSVVSRQFKEWTLTGSETEVG